MDIRLPNGQVISGVPEGTSREEVMRKAIQAGLATYQDFSPSPDVKAAGEAAVQRVADQQSPLARYAIGGREAINTAAGRIAGIFGDDSYQAETERNRELTDKVTGPEAFVGRALPVVAGTARIPGGIGAQTAGGAAAGGLTAKDIETGVALGALGGGGGAAAANTIGRTFNGITGQFADRVARGADEITNYIRRFQQLGGKLTPGQASGGGPARYVESALARFPLTAGAYRQMQNTNVGVLNRTAAKAIGQDADNLGPTVLRRASQALGREFDDIARETGSVAMPAEFAEDAAYVLPKAFVRRFEKALGDGSLSGLQFQQIRRRAAEIMSKGGDKAPDAAELVDALDEAFLSQAPRNVVRRYSAVRERWRNLIAIERYRRGVTGGDVNPLSMEGAVESIYGTTYRRDLGTRLPETQDFFDSVRVMADPRMQPQFGTSGTAENLSPWLLGGGATAGFLTDPVTTSAALGAGYALPRAIMAQPAPLAGQVGGAIGRQLPQFPELSQ